MDKESWKRFIETVSDEFLVQFSNKTRVKVNGFANITIQNIKLARPKILPYVTMKFVSVMNKAKEWIEEEGWSDYRSKPTSELHAMLENNNDMYGPVMLALILGDDINRITANVIVDKYVQNVPLNVGKPDVIKEEIKDDGKKQINALKKKLDALNHQLTQVQEANKKLSKEIEALKKQHKEEKKKWETEKLEFQETIQTKEQESVATTKTSTVKQIPRIAFVCSSNKMAEGLSQSLWYKINQVDPSDIEYESLRDFSEVWIMNADMNLREQRQCKAILKGKTTVRMFDNNETILQYMEQNKGE